MDIKNNEETKLSSHITGNYSSMRMKHRLSYIGIGAAIMLIVIMIILIPLKLSYRENLQSLELDKDNAFNKSLQSSNDIDSLHIFISKLSTDYDIQKRALEEVKEAIDAMEQSTPFLITNVNFRFQNSNDNSFGRTLHYTDRSRIDAKITCYSISDMEATLNIKIFNIEGQLYKHSPNIIKNEQEFTHESNVILKKGWNDIKYTWYGGDSYMFNNGKRFYEIWYKNRCLIRTSFWTDGK